MPYALEDRAKPHKLLDACDDLDRALNRFEKELKKGTRAARKLHDRTAESVIEPLVERVLQLLEPLEESLAEAVTANQRLRRRLNSSRAAVPTRLIGPLYGDVHDAVGGLWHVDGAERAAWNLHAAVIGHPAAEHTHCLVKILGETGMRVVLVEDRLGGLATELGLATRPDSGGGGGHTGSR